MFQLTNYDPKSPALYIPASGEAEWRVSPQNAKMMYYNHQERIITKPEDFERLGPAILRRLMKEHEAETFEELWEAMSRNVTYNAPGHPLNGLTPQTRDVPHLRSTPRTRRRGLRVHAANLLEYSGPEQSIKIAKWLADQHDGKVLDDEEFERSMFLMQRINPVKTRQSIILIWQYYRPRFIKCGGLVEA